MYVNNEAKKMPIYLHILWPPFLFFNYRGQITLIDNAKFMFLHLHVVGLLF